MITAPSIKSFLSANFTKEQAIACRDIIKGKKDPEDYESVQKWVSQCFNRPSDHELRREALNEILEGYGVEPIEKNGYLVASYINMGDTYNATLLHSKGNWRITTWGDFVERNKI